MASALNKLDFTIFKKSVNTPDYPTSEWIINPDFTAVGGEYVSNKHVNRYWKQDSVDPQLIVPMTSGEMDAVDAAELANDKAEKKALLIEQFLAYRDSKYTTNDRIYFLEIYDAAGGSQKTYVATLWTWMDTVGAYFAGKADDIDAAADKTALDAVTWDFSTFDATDPEITIQGYYSVT